MRWAWYWRRLFWRPTVEIYWLFKSPEIAWLREPPQWVLRRGSASNRAGADINTRDYSGKTALHWASELGKEDILRLLPQNQGILDIPDGQGRTALMFAIENRQYAASKLLINEGAYTKVKIHGYTALHVASLMRDQAMIKMLVEHEANRGNGISDKVNAQ